MLRIFLLIPTLMFNLYASEPAHMSMVAQYKKPDNRELIIKEKIDITDNATKSKSFVKTKFYGMKHIKYVSIFHESSDPAKNFLVSFYFHGEDNEFAVKIAPVDLRKYFQKKISIDSSKNQCTKLIQAHFEEYNRKSRVFGADKERLVFETDDAFLEMAKKAKDNAFLKKNPSPLFVITNNCRGIGNFEFEWPGLIKGHFFIPPAFLDSIMGDYDKVKLGSSETLLPLNHFNAKTELRTTKFYANQVDLSGWYGVKNKFVQYYSSNKDPVYQWYDLGDFDQVSKNCPISAVEESLVTKSPSNSVVNFPVHLVKGKIPYEEFTAETRMKSGAVYMQEAVSYVQTPCKDSKDIKTPPNFLVPEGDGKLSSEEYWSTNKCAIIPHFFDHYEDILNYPVHLSKFEIDGVYVGRSRNEDDPIMSAFDKSLQSDASKRVPYAFSEFIGKYDNAVIETNNDFINVKLLNKDKNIIIGNISLAKLREEEKKPLFVSSFEDVDLFESNVVAVSALFGINPQPLVGDYNQSFDPDILDQSPVPFALVYDDSGRILNHHLPTIGIEQWYARKRGCKLVIDLISHERILPLARLEIDYFCSALTK